jgi:hypothetical protein
VCTIGERSPFNWRGAGLSSTRRAATSGKSTVENRGLSTADAVSHRALAPMAAMRQNIIDLPVTEIDLVHVLVLGLVRVEERGAFLALALVPILAIDGAETEGGSAMDTMKPSLLE